MIVRRRLVLAMGVSALAAPLASFGQPQRKVPRIGFLSSGTPSATASQIEALRGGLNDYGYVEGKNITVEIRSAYQDFTWLSESAEELARLKVDVIVAYGTEAVSAAKRATRTIPIVDPVIGDPVAVGPSSSLARPGGNVTGSVQSSAAAAAKRVGFLKEAVPRVRRIAVFFNPANGGSTLQLQAMHATANALKLALRALEVRTVKEFGAAFAAIAQEGIDAIVVSTDTFCQANAIEISDLAAKRRLPSAGATAYAVAGGLIGYGVNDADVYRHAAYFVDRILNGAKPGDLPIEPATRLDLVINLETAKALDITIPPSLLARADDVIR